MQDANRCIQRIHHLLGELPFFEGFSHDELGIFSNSLSLRFFPAQTCLFNEGDFGDYMLFVVHGNVEVKIASSHDSSQLVVAKFGPGGSIGEMSLIDDYPRSATITVVEDSDLLLLTRSRLDSICEQSPVTGFKFLKNLSKTLSFRLRQANGRFAEIS